MTSVPATKADCSSVPLRHSRDRAGRAERPAARHPEVHRARRAEAAQNWPICTARHNRSAIEGELIIGDLERISGCRYRRLSARVVTRCDWRTRLTLRFPLNCWDSQTLTITRKGGKVVTIPLAPRTARAIDLAIGDRTDGPVFLAADGRRLDRHGAGRIVRKTARHAGIGKAVTPHTLRHAFITAALDAGCRFVTSRKQPPMPTRGPSCGTTGPAAAWTGTPPASSPPMSRAVPGNRAGRREAPPGGNRRAELCAAADRNHCAAVTRRDLSANANRIDLCLQASRSADS